ncbi:MAG: hypothetical protein EOP34_09690 [Rickettsiales bacterium]|nr:MAG: hypothetical protein EOP34_09690 [Rickettsiales bacterium]
MLSASYRLVKKQVTTKQLLFFLLLIGTICSCKEPKSPQVTFDVPALIGKNIDEVRKVLGKPSSPIANRIEPSNPKEESFENDFEKNSEILTADFNTKSRRISRLSIFPSEDYNNLKDIMKIGNLDAIETPQYYIEGRHPILSNTDLSGIDIYIK